MKLYGKYFMILLKGQMQYKTSFFLTLIGQFLLSFSSLLGVYFLMLRFRVVQDFSMAEVLLCFSVMLMAFAVTECFFRGFDAFSVMLGNGEFDRILVRPRSAIFQVLVADMDFTRAGRLLQAGLVLAYAMPKSGVLWTPDKLLTLVLMLVGGVGVFAGLFILYGALCFFTTEGLEFINILTHGGQEFGRYPLVIYGKAVLKFFTFLVPHALFQYYPLLYLTGRSGNRLYCLLPLVALLFLAPCYLVWRIGVWKYRSTGS